MIPFVITGDTHGEYGRIVEIFNLMQKYYDCKEKYICVAGEFGFLFDDGPYEHKILDEIAEKDFTVIVVPGNHENYNAFQSYEIVDFHGARAHKVRDNIFYICRGEIFKIGNKSFFTMSGGESIDRYMRREDVSWWRAEMPTDEEYKYAGQNIENYRKAGNKIDYVISHTAPLSGLAYLGKDHGPKEYPLNNFLEYVRETLGDECQMHFFGHLHIDKELTAIRQRALLFDYVELDLEEE